jgi:hypothetical protein
MELRHVRLRLVMRILPPFKTMLLRKRFIGSFSGNLEFKSSRLSTEVIKNGNASWKDNSDLMVASLGAHCVMVN